MELCDPDFQMAFMLSIDGIGFPHETNSETLDPVLRAESSP